MMKRSRKSLVGLLFVVLILGCASYAHSWWLVMCAFFVFAMEYAEQEFADLKERLTSIEGKLDASREA